MLFATHMSHICRLSSLKGSVNNVNVSWGECRVTFVGFLPHLEVPFPQSPAVREELVSARIKGKMLILHRVSGKPQSINQAGEKETDIMCLSVCMCVCVCVYTFAVKPHSGGGRSAIFERGF